MSTVVKSTFVFPVWDLLWNDTVDLRNFCYKMKMLLLICLFQSASFRIRTNFCIFGEKFCIFGKMCVSEDQIILPSCTWCLPCLFIGFDSCSLLVCFYQQPWFKKKKYIGDILNSFYPRLAINRFIYLCSSVCSDFSAPLAQAVLSLLFGQTSATSSLYSSFSQIICTTTFLFFPKVSCFATTVLFVYVHVSSV